MSMLCTCLSLKRLFRRCGLFFYFVNAMYMSVPHLFVLNGQPFIWYNNDDELLYLLKKERWVVMGKVHTANKSLIKDINTSTILQIVRERGPVSRADISKITGLNPATVSSNILNLIELGVVKEVGIGESSGGRKPTLLELNAGAFYVIGVDMGTTQVNTAVADMEGRIRHKTAMPFLGAFTPDEVLGVIKRSVHQVIERSGVDKGKILGIGMGIHGLVDSERGVSLFAPAFQWENVPVKDIFADEFSLPVTIDNDVRAMALGEKWFGSASDVSHFIVLNIGTGIGSGIYVNGELLRGAHFGAGEIGHISVVEQGEPCFCGKNGCLSTVASGPAMERRAREAIAGGEPSLITGLVQGDISKITGEIIYAAAVKGDALARRILDETGRYIGHAVSILVNVLNPEKILIGGGVAGGGEFLFRGMREIIAAKSMKNNIEKLTVGPTGLGGDCGMVGAAALILKDIFENPNQFKS